MDLKSFYKKIDVESIKNKLPPLPQIKIPKIKSRKIFKSSREDLAQQQSPTKAMGSGGMPITPQSLPGHSSFIDRTPTRISTVSSLMNINYGFKDKHESGLSTYRTANNFEEENCPDEFDTREPVSGSSVKRFGDRCKKTYKDFSEFKIKNIFAKKTVVKKTEIEVDMYARQYERDLHLEEKDLDERLEQGGYNFEFKEARRRLSRSSGSISPPDSLISGVPSPVRSELGHLQRNETPPLLAKRRNAISHADALRQKFQRSMSLDSNEEPPTKPNRSSLWAVNENSSHAESTEEQVQVHRPGVSRLSKFKKSMREGMSGGVRDPSVSAESGDDQPRARTSRMAKFKRTMKDGISEGFSEKSNPAESGEDQPQSQRAGPSRMARFKKSVKDGISEGFSDKNIPEESGDDQPQSHRAGMSKMARFKKSMKDGISEGFSDRNVSAESETDQPSASKAGTSRMARFKKSMKDGISESFADKKVPADSEDDHEQNSAHKAGTSRMARFKKSMKEQISEGFSDKNVPAESGDDQPKSGESRMARFKKSMKEGMSHDLGANSDSTWNLKGIRNRFASEDPSAEQKPKKNLQSQESLDAHSDHEKKSWKFSNIHLRRSEPTDKSNAPDGASSPEGKFTSIKMSINRLKNRKNQRQTSEDSDAEQNEESTKPNMSDQLKAGLRRLKLRERSCTLDEDEPKTPKESATISRVRNWKKSIKTKKPIEATSEDDGASAQPPPPPPLPGRSLTLIKKLNHIRSRKVASEDGEDSADPCQGNEQKKQKPSNLEKLEEARNKAMQKVNAQMLKMKNFHNKSRDSPPETSPEKPRRKTYKSDSDEQSDETMHEPSKAPAAVWTTNKRISQSLESEDEDANEEMPRVLIHQDNSDQYESRLIIAVTRPAPPVPPAVIREIIPKIKYQAPKTEWIPNKNAISSFLEMTPSPESSTQQLDVSRGHLRKRSMDSNDSDSWIPDNFHNKSCSSSTSVGLNKISENAEAWGVQSVFSEEKLYKAKSIDIFANRDGGAFRDFDDEMKNVPVRRIMTASAESLDKSLGESSDDDGDEDYDSASRITRLKHESPMVSTKVAIETIRSGSLNGSTDSNKAYRGSPVPTKKAQIGNSQESLDANYDENDEISSDEDEEEDDDDTPTMAPSPPPSFSPPPPPLPLRKPPRLIPERNDSMVRLAHPLVKQGSLRRHFSEEIEPSDLGKVNKLITRFEKNPSNENIPRIHLIASGDDDDDGSFEVEEKDSPKIKENGAKKRPLQMSSSADSDSFEMEDKFGAIIKQSHDKHRNSRTSDEEGNCEQKKITRSSSKRRPAPLPNQTMKMDNSRNNNNNNDTKVKIEQQSTSSPEFDYRENLDNVSIQSPTSVYGSPIGSICLSERISISSEYGSPMGGGTYQTKTMDQLRSNRRLSNRSSLRDDDTFYSFESDEENNFYSLGDSSDMRYTIEI